MTRLFPSIIPDSDGAFVDDSYQRAELERKDYQELREIAADHPTDEAHGKMSREDMVDGLVGKNRQ